MKKSFLLCATAVLLTACGGGGGGGNAPTTAPTPTVNPENTKSVENKTTETPPIASDDSHTKEDTIQAPKIVEAKPPVPDTAEKQPTTTTKPKSIEPKVENNKLEVKPLPPIKEKPEIIKKTTKLENTGLSLDRSQLKKGEIKQKPVTINGQNIAVLAGHNRNYSFNGAIMMKNKDDITAGAVDKVSILLLNEGVEYVASNAGLANWQVYALKRMAETGWNALKSSEIERDVFYDGLETPISAMPMIGKATYKGNITRLDNNSANVVNIGKSELIADFGNKTIQGTLTTDNRWWKLNFPRNISLEPTRIVGNSFNGTAIAQAHLVVPISRTGKYEGKFYGPNAEEVAGRALFEGQAFWGGSLEDLNTSFSAERDAIR